MRRITLLFLFAGTFVFAQTPTWSDNIAKIIYNNCTECHRSGAIATFPLETYADASSHAFSIKYYTSLKTMPPWKADPTYNHFKGERKLTDQQISDLADWVNAGAPSGDLSKAPTAPVFPSGIKMQNPDKNITIPAYSVSKNVDDYRCFVIPSGVTVDKFLTEIEFEPQNYSIVHHILLYQDNATTCLNLDNADPLPGYAGTGGGIGSNTATLIGGWVPGGGLMEIPTGMGIRLKANSYYILQIHYAPGSMNKKDSTKVHFKYSTLASPREVYVQPILNHINAINGGLTNGPLYIPANTVKTFNQLYTVSNATDYSIISVAPHQHYLGQTYRVFAVTPTNDTLKMCYIPKWDFNWQGAYTFQKIMKLPKLSQLYGIASYDNTTNNIYNPSSPPKNVSLGENTTDEMMLCYFTFTIYQAGDENIILDSSLLGPTGIRTAMKSPELNLYPNPVHNTLSVDLDKETPATVTIFDINGKEINRFETNSSYFTTDVSAYNEGIYLIKIQQGETLITNRFVKY